MANSSSHLDRHFTMPTIRTVDAARPLVWLRKAWNDVLESPVASLSYGVFFSVLGYLTLAFASDKPHLFPAAISGFFLVGPLAAAGLYEISHRHEAGRSCSLVESMAGIVRHKDQLFQFGLLLAIVLIGWERMSAILFAMFFGGDAPDPGNFFTEVLFSGRYVHFVVAYMVLGGALAALVFALAAVAVPMLMDRESDVVTAMMSSARAVGCNPGAMILWAAIIVAGMLLGFASLMFGMIVLLPIIGHATWHAYRDLVA